MDIKDHHGPFNKIKDCKGVLDRKNFIDRKDLKVRPPPPAQVISQ